MELCHNTFNRLPVRFTWWGCAPHFVVYIVWVAATKWDVHTPTVGFYTMAAHTQSCAVDVTCTVGMGLRVEKASGTNILFCRSL